MASRTIGCVLILGALAFTVAARPFRLLSLAVLALLARIAGVF